MRFTGRRPTVPGFRPYGGPAGAATRDGAGDGVSGDVARVVTGVVGLALVDELSCPTTLLAARRSGAAYAGGWELPGGKVEQGESWEDAAHREIAEELGVTIELGDFLPGPAAGGLWSLGPSHAMGVWLARVRQGVPAPLAEHDAIRTLRRDELYDVDWLPGDLPVVRAIEPIMGPR